MDKYICDCCGGQINRATMKCEYCGTAYKDDVSPIRFETYSNPVKPIRVAFSIDRESISDERYAEDTMRYVAREMTHKIAEEILPYCIFETDYDPRYQRIRLFSQCKIVMPIEGGIDRFGEELRRDGWIK